MNSYILSSSSDDDGDLKRLKDSWISEQERLRKQHIKHSVDLGFQIVRHGLEPKFPGLNSVAGVDISFFKGDTNLAVATLVILGFPELKVMHTESMIVQLKHPYIPGFLAFREIPPLLQILENVKKNNPGFYPQVVLVDGNGLLHPRKFGLACHLGVVAQIPTIGIAKTLLQLPDLDFGDSALNRKYQPLIPKSHVPIIGCSGFEYGVAFRGPKSSTKPVFISVGHRISLDDAIMIVSACCKFRVPEPVRQADLISRELVRQSLN